MSTLTPEEVKVGLPKRINDWLYCEDPDPNDMAWPCGDDNRNDDEYFDG